MIKKLKKYWLLYHKFNIKRDITEALKIGSLALIKVNKNTISLTPSK